MSVRTQRTQSIVAARQAPLRERYAHRPQDALTRKAARTTTKSVPADDPFHGEVEIGNGYGISMRYGLDRYIGGLHDAPNPGDLLCAALAACADGTVRMIADLLEIELQDLEVEVSGELDVRGCLAADPKVRVGFERLDCRVRLHTADGTDPLKIEHLTAAAERYCVNLDTLIDGTDVRTTLDAAGHAG